ncbi:hypothetical protein CTA1_8832 [Colletotrichum tanaceti]|uniref:Uncharacterized protein n=1 Tax=Colletotrichum tanaceti TaxID=1306861 RepID=A0A4U6XCF4_9PEZI|nr:hypothetical protein CTA1_8832 [Colletotrichum tanaceti]
MLHATVLGLLASHLSLSLSSPSLSLRVNLVRDILVRDNLVQDNLVRAVLFIGHDGVVVRGDVPRVQHRPGRLVGAVAVEPAEAEDLVRPSHARRDRLVGVAGVVGRAVPVRVDDAADPSRTPLTRPISPERLEARRVDGAALDVELETLVEPGPERQVALREGVHGGVAVQGVREGRLVVVVVPAGAFERRRRRRRRRGKRRRLLARRRKGVDDAASVVVEAADVGVRQALVPGRRDASLLRLDPRGDGEAARHRDGVLDRLVEARRVAPDGLRELDLRVVVVVLLAPHDARRDAVLVVVEPEEHLAGEVPPVLRRVGQPGAGLAVVDEPDDAELDGVFAAVAQQRQPRGDVDLVVAQVEGVDADDGPVQLGHDAAGEDDGERPVHARQAAVDEDLDLAERGVAREIADVRLLFEGAGGGLRRVGPPELLLVLRLDGGGEDGAVRVAGEAQERGGVVCGVRPEGPEVAGRRRLLRHGEDEVGGRAAPRPHGALEEGGREGGVQEAGVGVVDLVLELEEQGLGLPPEREVGGDVLEPGPGDAARRGLGGGGGEEVDAAEERAAPAVELAAADLDGEVDDDVVEPGSGEARGRRVLCDKGFAVAGCELVLHEGDGDGLVGGGAGREEDRLGDLERFQ